MDARRTMQEGTPDRRRAFMKALDVPGYGWAWWILRGAANDSLEASVLDETMAPHEAPADDVCRQVRHLWCQGNSPSAV